MMSMRVGTCVVLLTLAMGCTPAAPPPPDTAAMVAAATDLDERFLSAFNAGDAATMASLYWNSPEAVSFPPDSMVLRGSAIAAGMGATMEMLRSANARLTISESHQIPAGDVVIGWGLWTMTMTGPDGAPTEMQGRFSDVKAERDGRWVYLVDHASVPLPPAPPAM